MVISIFKKFKPRELPKVLIDFTYWELLIPGYRTPARLIFGNTMGYRKNISLRLSIFKRSLNFKKSSKPSLNKTIEKLNKEGYLRPNKLKDKTIKPVISEYRKSIIDNSKIHSVPNNSGQLPIKDPLINMPGIMNVLKELNPILKEYHQGTHYISRVNAWRNQHVSSKGQNRDVGISNAFHNDGIGGRNLSVFVLLSDDVTRDSGATKFLNRSDSVHFTRDIRYFSRRFVPKNLIDKIYEKTLYFEGDSGDVCFLNVDMCLHGASIPSKGRKRDILSFMSSSYRPMKEEHSIEFN